MLPGVKLSTVLLSSLLALGLLLNLTLTPSWSGNQFHSFIEDTIIPGFEAQRQHVQGCQFAVILLFGEGDLNHVALHPLGDNEQPLVNNTNPYSPNRGRYGNYVVARPHQYAEDHHITHSEIILLQELPHLWEAFEANHGTTPVYVLLYTWLMPCPDCTEHILQTFLQQSRYKNTSMIIAYTADWEMVSEAGNDESRHRLWEAGIIVERVEYSRKLPPAG